MKISLLYIGKARDPHANALAAEYIKRSSRYSDCEMREIAPPRYDLFAKHASGRKIFLDPAGQSLTSQQFAEIFRQAETVGQSLVFLLGGHDGLPPQWQGRADLLLSLSPMTLPHELARTVLAEQIYRAFATLRGHPYPR